MKDQTKRPSKKNSMKENKGYPYKKVRKEFLKVKEDDFNWESCIICGGELTQERKAFFVCVNCKQEYIADEEDMKK